MKRAILSVLVLFFSSIGFCAELLVPSQYLTIQEAVNAASAGDTVIIELGAYTGAGNYNISFTGKTVTVRSADPNNPTIVESTIIDCNNLGVAINLDANSIIDGLTIIDGNSSHGAIYVFSGYSPVIRNCVISNNSSTSHGGGIYSLGRPTITKCRINGNHAGTSYGGGIYCSGASNTVTITDCNISGNTSGYGGICGAVSGTGWVKINRSVITNNNTTGYGGGIYVYSGVMNINSSIVVSNHAQFGGAVYIRNLTGTAVTAEGCTFAENAAVNSGGGVYLETSNFSVSNSIFWGNSDNGNITPMAQIRGPAGWTSAFFCCIQDRYQNDGDIAFGGADNGNIDVDPMFADSANGDYHLSKDSPCIEAGNPLSVIDPNATDIDGQPRVTGLVMDMGADEAGKIIVVTKPVAGEVWAEGSRHQIKWTKYGVGSVDIRLSSDGGTDWQTIANNVDSNNYLWTLPRGINSDECLISVEPNNGDGEVVIIKSKEFTIWPYPILPAVPPSLKGKLPGPDLSQNIGPEVGCVKWVFETDGAVSSQVAVTRPYWDSYGVYIGCEDGNLYALDDLGNFIWSYDINSPIVGSPAAGYYWMVYVAGQNGWLYAIDDYGELRWKHKTDAAIYSTPVVGYDGKIYVCSEDGLIYALGPDGSELWTFATKGSAKLNGAILATPAIDKNGVVYVAGLYDPNLYALDANSGRVKWVCNFTFYGDPCNPKSGEPFASPAIGPNGTIYQTLIGDANLYAIDPCDGSIIWSTYLRQGSDTNASGWSSPAVGPDGTIYVSFDDPYLRAVSPDGQIEWVTRLGTVGGFTLSVDKNGLIYAASDDNYVCVVNAAGDELSHFKGNDWVTFPVIAEDGTLIVSDANNRVWAITDTPCQPEQSVLHWIADLQLNWAVDFIDFALMANDWLLCTDPANPACDASGPEYRPGDINRSYYVDYEDIAAFSNLWLMEAGL